MIEVLVIGARDPSMLSPPRPAKRKPLPRAIFFFLGSAVFWLALWSLASALEVVPALFLPSPLAVAHRFVTTLTNGFADATLLQHTAASLYRVLSALAFAIVVGVPVGIGMGLSPVLRGLFDPVIEAYRPIPPLAYLPLVVIWFGIGEGAQDLADLPRHPAGDRAVHCQRRPQRAGRAGQRGADRRCQSLAGAA